MNISRFNPLYQVLGDISGGVGTGITITPASGITGIKNYGAETSYLYLSKQLPSQLPITFTTQEVSNYYTTWSVEPASASYTVSPTEPFSNLTLSAFSGNARAIVEYNPYNVLTTNAEIYGLSSNIGGYVSIVPPGVTTGPSGTTTTQYIDGAGVSLTATPAGVSYYFSQWSSTDFPYIDGLSAASVGVTMVDNATVSALFRGVTLTASVVITSDNGYVGGTVLADPVGFSLSGTTTISSPIDYGTILTLTPIPYAGYAFYGWDTYTPGITTISPTIVQDGITFTGLFLSTSSLSPPVVPTTFYPNYSDIGDRLTRQYCCNNPAGSYPSYAQYLNTKAARLNGKCCPYTAISAAFMTGQGSGFTGGDLLRLNGGTPYGSISTILSVVAVSPSGGILNIIPISGGYYTTQPSEPYSLTIIRAGLTPTLAGVTLDIVWGNSICTC